MADFDSSNRGTLFKNNRRRNNGDPFYKGNISIDGRDYSLSAWLKTARDGEEYLSLAVRPKDPEARRLVG
jgi:hypothetical protein